MESDKMDATIDRWVFGVHANMEKYKLVAKVN